MSIASILIGYAALIATCGWLGVAMVAVHVLILATAANQKIN